MFFSFANSNHHLFFSFANLKYHLFFPFANSKYHLFFSFANSKHHSFTFAIFSNFKLFKFRQRESIHRSRITIQFSSNDSSFRLRRFSFFKFLQFSKLCISIVLTFFCFLFRHRVKSKFKFNVFVIVRKKMKNKLKSSNLIFEKKRENREQNFQFVNFIVFNFIKRVHFETLKRIRI